MLADGGQGDPGGASAAQARRRTQGHAAAAGTDGGAVRFEDPADAAARAARSHWRRSLAALLALLAAGAVVLFGGFWLLDFFYLRPVPAGSGGPLGRLLAFDPDTLQNALGNLAQIIAAVLGIAITVVSIVVQLAATRYTSRIADLFFRDRINLAVMGFFVVSCIMAVWVSLAVSHDHVPEATVLVTVALVTGSLLALIPYFAYVFDFLDPKKVIARIGEHTLESALGRTARGRALGTSPVEVAARQTAAVTSMEQLADIAMNAVAQKDKVIAAGAIVALGRVMGEYLPQKPTLPARWFAVGAALRESHDFVALAAESVAELEASRVWVEWKGLRALRGVLGEAVKELPEMAHVVPSRAATSARRRSAAETAPCWRCR